MNGNNSTNIQTVRREQLEALAAQAPRPAATRPTANGHRSYNGEFSSRLDVPRWLRDRGVEYRVKQQPEGKGRTVYVFKRCPFNPDHSDPDSCIMQGADGAMSAQCFHNSCNGRFDSISPILLADGTVHRFDGPRSAPARRIPPLRGCPKPIWCSSTAWSWPTPRDPGATHRHRGVTFHAAAD